MRYCKHCNLFPVRHLDVYCNACKASFAKGRCDNCLEDDIAGDDSGICLPCRILGVKPRPKSPFSPGDGPTPGDA